MAMHLPTSDDVAAAQRVTAWSLARLGERDAVLPPAVPGALPELSAEGIGIQAAVEALLGVVLPTAVPTDHPRFLAFVPGAPSVAAAIADMAIAAAGVFGGSLLEAGLATAAEDAVIRWLADVIGYPASAGGTFVSGGTAATLSALVAARGERYLSARPQVVVAGAAAHSSVSSAARVMGCRLVTAPPADAYGRLTPPTLARALEDHRPEDVVAVVATAGATNNGAVDDLAGLAALCHERGIWLHVDGAYGGAALLAREARPLFAGLDGADSFIVDPHKWLYAPFDCGLLLYRDAAGARRALSQRADYLDYLGDESAGNPWDLAIHLSRRIRGVPLWVSLLANGWDAYRQAVEDCLALAGYAAVQIERNPHLELILEPQLTVVLFRRCGWGAADYDAWSAQVLARGVAFVVPTMHAGETVLRLCFVNPLTSRADVDAVLAALA